MIDVDVIQGAISELENKEMTFATLSKLSVLYIVKNNNVFKSGTEAEKSVMVSQTVPDVSDTPFINICRESDIWHIWEVLDELMTTLQVIYPKLYDETLKALKERV